MKSLMIFVILLFTIITTNGLESRLLLAPEPQPCPMPSCIAPCPEGKCAPDETCETRQTFINQQGTKCEMCAVFQACIPQRSGVNCGGSRCKSGDVCCNDSCGICTAPDGVCIQVFCLPG
eukprot:193281_1